MKFVCTPRNAHAPDFIQIMWTSNTNEKDKDEEAQSDETIGNGKIQGMH